MVSEGKLQRILVTGGAGYIGSHTVKLLAKRGLTPVILDDLTAGRRWAAQHHPVIVGNVGDSGLLIKVLRGHRIDAVMHFAAHAYVGESMAVPERYFRNNVVNTLNLLEAMLTAGVRNIIFSSSCATFGHPKQATITEQHTQHPVNPYGESKLFVERALHWYGVAHGFRSLCLRYFNAAGADPEGELGEDHDPETHLIPLVLQVALGLRQHVDVYGGDYETHDGTCVRDYVHVMDLAEAHVLGLHYIARGERRKAFNLGNGRGYSVREVIACAETITGRKIPVEWRPRRAGDPARLVSSSVAARRELGWSPKYPKLEQIVETAWRWHSTRHAMQHRAALA